jgi:hypothetical protein
MPPVAVSPPPRCIAWQSLVVQTPPMRKAQQHLSTEVYNHRTNPSHPSNSFSLLPESRRHPSPCDATRSRCCSSSVTSQKVGLRGDGEGNWRWWPHVNASDLHLLLDAELLIKIQRPNRWMLQRQAALTQIEIHLQLQR